VSPTVLAFAALLLLGGSVVLWFRRANDVRIPSNRALFVAAWLGSAALGVTALALGAGWLGGIAAVLATFGGCFFSFLVAISAQAVAPDALKVGAKLPEFSATDENGALFASSSLAGAPVLIKFFRGHW